jgi:hypothetical protein
VGGGNAVTLPDFSLWNNKEIVVCPRYHFVLDICHWSPATCVKDNGRGDEHMSELKTCFKKVDYDLSGLLHYIDIGDIGLPDIQRPFVWSNAKVRDLFDSMYRGFPVGYLLFWENANGNETRQIGLDGKQHSVPSRLIVDGQQRLTALFAPATGR